MTAASEHAREVEAGQRFRFGDNWARFLAVLDDERVAAAERSLVEMLGTARLDGKRVLDAGSGSGLFSLAAHRLGAEVTSFDFDPRSVACTEELRRRYADGSPRWSVREGSVLDPTFLAGLGTFDLVYSWGVLHHTGRMWDAVDLVSARVAPGGQLFIALYNDQGPRSKAWHAVKRTYNRSSVGRAAVMAAFVPYFVGKAAAADLVRGKNPLARHRTEHQARGMSMLHDIVDWLGGLPFEVATPAAVVDFLRERGFAVERLTTVGAAHGCNQFVARRAR